MCKYIIYNNNNIFFYYPITRVYITDQKLPFLIYFLVIFVFSSLKKHKQPCTKSYSANLVIFIFAFSYFSFIFLQLVIFSLFFILTGNDKSSFLDTDGCINKPIKIFVYLFIFGFLQWLLITSWRLRIFTKFWDWSLNLTFKSVFFFSKAQ